MNARETRRRVALDELVDSVALEEFRSAHGDPRFAEVVIVAAAYHEVDNIGRVVDALPAELCGKPVTFVVVIDGEEDGTAEIVRKSGHYAVVCPVNRGQGAALRLGYRIARDGGARYIVTTDADGQYNPAEIANLLGPVIAGEADFVTGSRRLGSEETRDPVRQAGVRFFAAAISVLTGQKISDTTFGLRAMRAEVTGAVQLSQPQYQASELLIGVITHGYKVKEVPATIHRRRVGESKKGHNPLYDLHIPGVNNLFYGMRFSRVVFGTWRRERQRASGPGSASPWSQRAAWSAGLGRGPAAMANGSPTAMASAASAASAVSAVSAVSRDDLIDGSSGPATPEAGSR